MKQYKAICFDFDYTLGDATDSIVAGFQHAFTQMGRPVPERESIRATIGYLLEDAYSSLSGDRSEEGRARFRPLYQEVALPMQVDGITLFPGTAQLLRALHAAGIRMAIVSTRRSATIYQTLERSGLLDTQEFIIGSADVTRHKPDPEGLNIALGRMGIAPHEMLFCGDTILDAGAAQNAGTHFAAVLNGTTPAEAFAQWPHVHIAKDLYDLAKWLGV